MTEQNYELGQTIYILSSESTTIIPVVITEELVHKKLDGNQITYKVSVGPKEKQKIINLDKISGEVYSSLDEIRTVLIERLTKFVDDLISTTEQNARQWYNKENFVSNQTQSSSSAKIDPKTLLEQQIQPVNNQQSTNPLRERLRALTKSEDELSGDVNEVGSLLIDGKPVKVRMNG